MENKVATLGLRLTSKGSKDLPGGKRLHFLVAIAFNKGVVLAKEYEHMSGEYLSDFIKTDLSKLFNAQTEQKWFVMDNDPSQRSKAARKAINEAGATLFGIPHVLQTSILFSGADMCTNCSLLG